MDSNQRRKGYEPIAGAWLHLQLHPASNWINSIGVEPIRATTLSEPYTSLSISLKHCGSAQIYLLGSYCSTAHSIENLSLLLSSDSILTPSCPTRPNLNVGFFAGTVMVTI